MIYINDDKLQKFKFKLDNLYVLLDFDKTITASKSLDSWAASGKMLSEDFNKKMDDLYNIYRPIELNYTMPKQEKEQHMEIWYRKCMDLYYEYHLTKKMLHTSICNSKIFFRKGAKEFLQYLHQHNIPCVILSAGIGNVIEQFLKENDCYFDNTYIISNFLEFDENGDMIKFKGNIIHSLNKDIENGLEKDALEKLNKRKYKLLVGDLIEDKNMVRTDIEHTLTIGFLDVQVLKNLEVFNKSFDVVLTEKDASFIEVKNILEKMIL